jgi:hypothetical protein
MRGPAYNDKKLWAYLSIFLKHQGGQVVFSGVLQTPPRLHHQVEAQSQGLGAGGKVTVALQEQNGRLQEGIAHRPRLRAKLGRLHNIQID